MRRGFDRLALLVQEMLKCDPHCGHLFVFRGKCGGLIKVLWHDGEEMCLLAKHLERGRFVWPRTEGEAVTIAAAPLGYLLEGIDWRLPQRTDWTYVAGGRNGATSRLGGPVAVASAWNTAANGAVTTAAVESLPDNVETLNAMLLAERQAHRAEMRNQVLQIEKLEQQIAELRHERFGQSSSAARCSTNSSCNCSN